MNRHNTLRFGTTSAGILIGAGMLWVATSVRADTVDELMRQLRAKGILSEQEYSAISKQPDAVAALLNRLQAKGILTKGEYSNLSEQHAAEPRPAPAAPAPAPAAPAPAPAAPEAQVAVAPPSTFPPSSFVRMMDKGVGLHIGPVDVLISGELNAFYVQDMPDDPDDDTTVLGGLAAVGGNSEAAVRNGLLPSNLTISLKTHQQGYDIGATFGMYPGLNSVTNVGGANSAGNPSGLGTSGIDFRQQFVTVGNEHMGTFKAGRDIGMFGSEAILNDLSLLGVGSPGANVAPSNTSFGRIGLGYVYTDWIPQITYMSPSFHGLQAGIGVFSPLDAENFSTASGTLSSHDEPQFQGKLTYDGEFGSVKSKLWTNFVTQKLQSNGGTDALPDGDDVRAWGVDLGGKFTVGPAELIAYGYLGKALGSTGLFFDAVDATGDERDSRGFYLQASYKLMERLTLGTSYGASYLDLADDESNPLLVERNDSALFTVHYQLTDWLKLVGEYVHTHSKAHGGNEADEDTIALGGILFF